MLILTEKPSVAKDFAKALGCHYSSADKCYKNNSGSVFITNCVGHLFQLEDPVFYNPEFKSWKKLPIIPEEFHYHVTSDLKDAAKVVVSLLKSHKSDEILIATDADREGEIIARECLKAAGISDFSKINRFWVSQALTPEVIMEGIKQAKALGLYSNLADQGFARQHSDWLVGINGTRFITNKAGSLFPIGRVQTSILSAISERCEKIDNFKPEKYFEITGSFNPPNGGSVKGILINPNGETKQKDDSLLVALKPFVNSRLNLDELKSEKREILPPQLYSLNDLQKDAFRYFNYSADKTLKLVQKLYEEYKCVSYPRTPSKVMGSQNVQLCRDLYQKFMRISPEYFVLHPYFVIDEKDKRIFNDAKLEAHHAIIPLDKLPASATGDEENIYSLILERFMLAFAPGYKYEKHTAKVSVGGHLFKIEGRKVIDEGWQKFRRFTRVLKEKEADSEEIQDLDNIDWHNLTLGSVDSVQKWTKPPKHFNEASILAFMENPKGESEDKKLCGLGTPATRHTFIPKLEKSKYIEVKNKNIYITDTGKRLLKIVLESPLSAIADVGETTRWEENLAQNPLGFETEIKSFIRSSMCSKGGSDE
ncbi:MAG: DNA topoisomerase [Treponema sp.]|nr:DNA topoisomerase [Treponema sp.]